MKQSMAGIHLSKRPHPIDTIETAINQPSKRYKLDREQQKGDEQFIEIPTHHELKYKMRRDQYIQQMLTLLKVYSGSLSLFRFSIYTLVLFLVFIV